MEEDRIFKESLEEVMNDFINIAKSAGGENCVQKIDNEDYGMMLVKVGNEEITSQLYNVAIIMSYISGYTYFSLFTNIPEDVEMDDVYRALNQLNKDYKISNLSFYVENNDEYQISDKDLIVMKCIELVSCVEDIQLVLNSLVDIANEELF